MTDDSHNPAHIFSGLKFTLITLVLLGGGTYQAATGWLGDSFYMRFVYPLLAAFLSIPFGLFAYAMFNQPKLRRQEEEKEAADNRAD